MRRITALRYEAKARCPLYRLIGSVHTLTGLPGAVAEFLRAMDSVRKSVATNSGLSAGELRAMAQIAESAGVTPKQLADELELTTGAITAITNGLVKKELIVRVEQAHDRRSLLLQLTPKGHTVMDGAYKQFQTVLAVAEKKLKKDEAAKVVHGLTLMTDSIPPQR